MLLRSQKKITNDKKNVVLNVVTAEKPKPPPKEEENADNNEEEDEDEFLENEYFFPSSLNENIRLKKLHQKIVDSIEKS